MPATIELILPAGLVPVEAIGGAVIFTCSVTRSDSPACSASAITGTSPAHDTRFSSSNRTTGPDHLCNNFTGSALRALRSETLDKPQYRSSEGTFVIDLPVLER